MVATITLIFSFLCQTQNYQPQNVDYREYHRRIDQAEILIMDSAYSNALNIYEKVFSEFQKGFAKDYYNAAICASYENRPALFKKYVGKLLCLGFSLETFPRLPPILKQLTKLSEDHQQSNNCDHDINPTLVREIDSLASADQAIRGPDAYTTRLKAVVAVDSSNYLALSKLISKHGFPSERTIGIAKNVFETPSYYIVVRHRYQNKIFDLSELLLNAVKNGDLLPEIFAELEDKKSNTIDRKWTYMSTMFYEVSGTMKEVPYDEDYLKRVDTNRHALGLDSLDVFKRKILFEKKDKTFCFFTHEGIVYLPGFSEKLWDEKVGKLKKN